MTGPAATAAGLILLVGCGAQPGAHAPNASSPTTSHNAARGMGAMDMRGQAAGAPSQSATMICRTEIRRAVQRTLHLTQSPSAKPHWSASSRTYTCDYAVPGGLTLSVDDALTAHDGRRHFTALRRSISGVTPIRGVQSLGFPALQARQGQVAFLKDGKTLLVDATPVAAFALPRGYTREDVAYAIASAVIACWSE